jgi:hypothetical protein
MNPNPIPGAAAVAGGGLFPAMPPIWYPPVELKWIGTGLIVFAGAVANRVKPHIRGVFTSPLGFFLTGVLAIAMFKYGFKPAAFAILFFLLNMWAADVAAEAEGWRGGGGGGAAIGGHTANDYSLEGFLNASSTVDWVTNHNHKRWFVERVLKEDPIAIQEKDVATYPVESYSAQGSTSTSVNT